MHVTKIEHTERDLLEKEDMVANLVMLQQHGENLEQGLWLWCRSLPHSLNSLPTLSGHTWMVRMLCNPQSLHEAMP